MIPITKIVVGEEESRAAAEAIASGWVAQGPRVAQFEAEVARFLGAEHAVALSSGTAALHLALVALGVGPGDEVVVPSLSFIATANAALYCGARPVFADVDPRTYNVTPDTVSAALTPRTRVIMPVHQVGLPADLPGLRELARRRGVALVEDAACALGAETPLGLVGSDDLACFSFHPRKVITTGEGGLITTPDGRLAERLRVLRSQGMSVPADQRHGAGAGLVESFSELGYNYRLTDIQAAVGLEQMKRLPWILRRRRLLGRRYSQLLARRVPWVQPPRCPEGFRHTYQSYMVLLDAAVPRRGIMDALERDGVGAKRAVTAIHLEPLYRAREPDLALPHTEAVARRGVMLPLYPQMTEAEQDHVVDALARCAPWH